MALDPAGAARPLLERILSDAVRRLEGDLYFLYAGCEVSFEVQEFISRFDKTCHARLFQSYFGKEHLTVFIRFQFGDVGFCLGGNNQDLSILVFYGFAYHIYVFISVYCACFINIADIHYRFAG